MKIDMIAAAMLAVVLGTIAFVNYADGQELQAVRYSCKSTEKQEFEYSKEDLSCGEVKFRRDVKATIKLQYRAEFPAWSEHRVKRETEKTWKTFKCAWVYEKIS
jgi:hypothetical protein